MPYSFQLEIWHLDTANPSTKIIEKFAREVTETLITEYHNKANRHSAMYFGSQIAIIVLGALIPIINIVPIQLPEYIEINIINAILGAAIAVLTAFLQLFKSHEGWLNYRWAENLLQIEKRKFVYYNDLDTSKSVTSKSVTSKSYSRTDFVDNVNKIHLETLDRKISRHSNTST